MHFNGMKHISREVYIQSLQKKKKILRNKVDNWNNDVNTGHRSRAICIIHK